MDCSKQWVEDTLKKLAEKERATALRNRGRIPYRVIGGAYAFMKLAEKTQNIWKETSRMWICDPDFGAGSPFIRCISSLRPSARWRKGCKTGICLCASPSMRMAATG